MDIRYSSDVELIIHVVAQAYCFPTSDKPLIVELESAAATMSATLEEHKRECLKGAFMAHLQAKHGFPITGLNLC